MYAVVFFLRCRKRQLQVYKHYSKIYSNGLSPLVKIDCQECHHANSISVEHYKHHSTNKPMITEIPFFKRSSIRSEAFLPSNRDHFHRWYAPLAKPNSSID